MLVIRRRAGESILIGEDVEIQIAEIGATRVKLAVSAPVRVPVLRKEAKLTRDQNLAAAGPFSPALVEDLAVRLRAGRQSAREG